jgi:filamentous hemagglutinin
VPYTLGFESQAKLIRHFIKHGQEFSVITEAEYEKLADAFLGGPQDADTLECRRRSDGAILRYNPVTNEYGVLRRDGVMKTYFKPDVARHGKPTNLDYFLEECAK